ncbi:MAG: GHMP kinase [Chloroflexota bacterium]
MIIIRKRTYARAGLLGNPSDGYNGKTISFSLRNFWAEVVLYEWDSVDIVLAKDDRASFNSVYDLAQDVQLHGYYGGIRLIKATIKRFVEYCVERDLTLHERNFSVRYETNIPRQVGLAGSSGIIVATLRCLMEFYNIEIPLEIQPSFVLSVEIELGIMGGLQDRVIQCYEGMVYMDFAKEKERQIEGLLCYDYTPLDPALLPHLYVSYHDEMSEPTEVFHNDIRSRYDRGEETVVKAMEHFAQLTAWGQDALLAGDSQRLGELIDENFDTRLSIFNLAPWQVQMIETARSCGATAKFAGSGGGIVGTYQGEEMFQQLCHAMGEIGSRTIKPA